MNVRSLAKVNREHGVSLLEALITIFVLAFGILGLANLHGKLQTVEVETYARSQALVLLDDMGSSPRVPRAGGRRIQASTGPMS